MHRYKKSLENIGITLGVLLIVFTTLSVIDLISDRMSSPILTADDLPVSIELKAAPADVVHSESYLDENGEPIVKYAYMTEVVPPEAGEDISKRTPNSVTEVIAVEQEGAKRIETLKTTFFGQPQFYKDGGEWRQLEYATTTPEIFAAAGVIPHIKRREFLAKLLPGRSAFALTSTFYPDPDPETSSVDGVITASGNEDTGGCGPAWQDVYAQTTGTVDASGTTAQMQMTSGGFMGACSVTLSRLFLLFDTASLPDAATVSDAVVSVYVDTAVSISTIYLQNTTPASNNALVGADFDNISTTVSGGVSSFTTSAYNSFTLNGTGIAAINLTGVSKFGARYTEDISNTLSPAGLPKILIIRTAETAGTTQDPKLEVTYTVDSFAMWEFFPF